MADRNILMTSQTRAFMIEGGAGPRAIADYLGLGRATAAEQTGGDVTPIRKFSDARYRDYEIIGKTVAPKELPTFGLETWRQRAISEMQTLFQKGCIVDVQVHSGSCTDPTDFGSFEVADIFENAQMTAFSVGDLGEFEAETQVAETLPFTAEAWYQAAYIRDSEIAAGDIVQEVIGLAVADVVSCGECGIPSDGAQVFFALQLANAGSPGQPAELIFTDNGGSTVGSTIIDTMGADEDPTDLAAVGRNIVAISGDDLALHYAPIDDILGEEETWTRVDTGFVASKLPNRIFSRGRTFTWIVADGGYVYFTADITAGVEVQSDGSGTVQNLADIHGSSDEDLVAVGASNAVLVTGNGGDAWSAVTGPNVGVDLTAVWMHSRLVWFVGDASGNLWYTIDGGSTWTAKAFNGSGSGAINAIAFSTKSVGFMAHTVDGQGYILRTIDGGATWQRAPEAAGVSITENDRINRLAVAASAPDNIRANWVLAGGLGANAVDGILLKLSN